MIFTGIKRKSNQLFFNKRLPELLKKSVGKPSQKITSILVLLDEFSDKKGINSFLNEVLGIPKNQIELLVFQRKIKKEKVLDNIITPVDFGWYGKINSGKLKNILTKKYDLLINYSKVDTIYCNLLLLQCNVGFRIGFSHLDNRFYDLIINCESTDIESFNKEIKKYLQILNKIG